MVKGARTRSRSSPGGGFTVKTYQGDAKTLLAFNLPDRESARNLAGFTIQAEPPGKAPYYLLNRLQFQTPSNHTQIATEPPYSSANAPFHKFRWLYIPASTDGTAVVYGSYVFRVTPRFFDENQSLEPIDPSLTVETRAVLGPFQTKGLELGFTRGFVQSQAFADHFGVKAPFRPPGHDLIFDTSVVAGTNPSGQTFTFEDEYIWSGFTARQKIFAILDDVLGDRSLSLDMFAYDLSEPLVVKSLLTLAAQGRVRVILDNASLHKSTTKKQAPEDLFQQAFEKAAKGNAAIKRGKFGRYAHDKILIVSSGGLARKVLTGSTNFSVTGVYVNSNHVLVFNDPKVAGEYLAVFNASWNGNVQLKAFLADPLSSSTFQVSTKRTPPCEITFSPHSSEFAEQILDGLVARVEQEGKTAKGSVLFAVMDLDTKSTGPVYPALRNLHENQTIFSYGISDTTSGTRLYTLKSKEGLLVTGKPGSAQLPPPFDQVKQIGADHQVHDKFVVCGFNGDNPVVYCGSSNLALGGEEENGDNLIAIHDGGVATAFAIEALALVDHFEFLDKVAAASKSMNGKTKPKPTMATRRSTRHMATSAGWFLGTTDAWVEPYFDPDDLRSMDRELFG
jgi:hypothetical protein